MQIIRNGTVVLTIPLGQDSTSGTVEQGIMSLNRADISFTLPYHVELLLGDQVSIHGEVFYLNKLPRIDKISTLEYRYECKFENHYYILNDIQFLGLNSNNQPVNPEFPFMGTASDYVDLILANIARFEGGWAKGNVIETEARPMSFQGDNCLSVLARLATEFNTEFWVQNKVIHLNKQGSTVPLTFQYGKNKGLYGLSRDNKPDSRLITRLYVAGSTRNITGDYRDFSERLLIPTAYGSYYIDQNTDKYGVREGSAIFDDVYPHRVGTVTEVGSNVLSFVDEAIDFDVNQYLVSGISVKLTFNSGQLAGYTFEVVEKTGFNNATKTFTLLPNKEDKGIIDSGGNATEFALPNDTMKPAVGDTYVLTDIYMPQSYVDEAENELLIRAQEHLAEVSNPNLQYSLTPDVLYFKREGIELNIGDSVTVFDAELGVNRPIRITALSRDAFYPYKYTSIALQDVVQVPGLAQLATQIKEIKKAINQNDLSNPYRARMNWKSVQELNNMLFDTENNYYTEIIKPLIIETAGITVGTKSGQYLLNGVIFSPNDNGLVSRFGWTSGELVHYEIEEAVRTWQIDSGLMIALQDNVAYYLYAKCEREGENGTILVTTEQIRTTDVAGFYHFPIGVLHSVIDNVRAISLTYGFTQINGKFIRTGVIVSSDGATEFNLETGTISGRIVFGNNGASSIIDGNLITTSTIMLGSGTGVKVGMTGQGEAETDVRIWAGADYANRGTAAFRVLQNGKMFASNAEISGHIGATSGKIGQLSIADGGIRNDNNTAYVALKKDAIGGGVIRSVMGTTAYPDSQTEFPVEIAALFENSKVDPEGINIAAQFLAQGSRQNIGIETIGLANFGAYRINPVVVSTANYTCTWNDHIIFYSGPGGTINLPGGAGISGTIITIRKLNGSSLTISANGRQIRGGNNSVVSSASAANVEEYILHGSEWVDMTD